MTASAALVGASTLPGIGSGVEVAANAASVVTSAAAEAVIDAGESGSGASVANGAAVNGSASAEEESIVDQARNAALVAENVVGKESASVSDVDCRPGPTGYVRVAVVATYVQAD